MEPSYCTPGNQTCNFTPGSPNLYDGVVDYNYYGYNVSKSTATIFVVFFAIPTVLHLVLGIYLRKSWMLYTVFLGGIGETLGWSGRLWSAYSVRWLPDAGGLWDSNNTAFLLQISTLIFSPAFMQAGFYILLGRVIEVLGPQYSFIHPYSYAIVFVFGDVVGLVIQATGGGIASAATTLQGANNGGYIMLGGVVIQLVVMVAYTIILISYLLSYVHKRPYKKHIQLFTWWPNALRTKSNRAMIQDRKHSSSSTSSASSTTVVNRADSDFANSNTAAAAVTQGMQSGNGGAGMAEKGGVNGVEKAGDLEGGATATVRLARIDGKDIVVDEKLKRGAFVCMIACSFCTLLIFIRSIYRVAELAKGWHGPIITQQPLFNWLDGFLMCLCLWTFIPTHPGFWLRGNRTA